MIWETLRQASKDRLGGTNFTSASYEPLPNCHAKSSFNSVPSFTSNFPSRRGGMRREVMEIAHHEISIYSIIRIFPICQLSFPKRTIFLPPCEYHIHAWILDVPILKMKACFAQSFDLIEGLNICGKWFVKSAAWCWQTMEGFCVKHSHQISSLPLPKNKMTSAPEMMLRFVMENYTIL